jgi:HEAT repeat protein
MSRPKLLFFAFLGLVSVPVFWLLCIRGPLRHKYAIYRAQSIAALGPAARNEVPALIEALREGPGDYDTGDGVLLPLTYSIQALGKIGDERAIEPLASMITHPREMEYSATAIPIDRFAGVDAAAEALARFGARARGESEALRGVLLRPEYLPHRGSLSLALAALGDPPSAAAIGRALGVTWAEQGASRVGLAQIGGMAQALEKMGPLASDQVEVLLRILAERPRGENASDLTFPFAVRALGALQNPRAVRPLVDLLGEPELCRASLTALRLLGPHAAGNEKAVAKVVASPPFSDADGIGRTKRLEAISYGLQALVAMGSCAAREEIERLSVKGDEKLKKEIAYHAKRAKWPAECGKRR